MTSQSVMLNDVRDPNDLALGVGVGVGTGLENFNIPHKGPVAQEAVAELMKTIKNLKE